MTIIFYLPGTIASIIKTIVYQFVSNYAHEELIKPQNAFRLVDSR